MNRLMIASVCLVLACGDDSPSANDTSSGSDASATTSASTTATSDDGSSTAGADTTGGMVDPTPILEREPMLTHSCAETRAMTQEAGATSGRTDALLAIDDATFVLRSDETLRLAPIALDGTLGDDVVLEAESFVARGAIATTMDAGIATIWTYGGAPSSTLRFAVHDADLAVVVEPKTITGLSAAYLTAAAIVPADGGGLALFYGESSEGGQAHLRMVELDATGEPTGEPIDVADIGQSFGTASASAARTSDGGYAVTYLVGEPTLGEIWFVILDAAGVPAFAPTRLSRAGVDGWSAGFGYAPRTNLLPVGDAYWVAFTETWADYDTMTGHSVVRIAIVDGNGNAEGNLLQAPVDGKNNLWPTFVRLEDRVGLLWTSGTIIWICGGCIADNDLQFVLLDPDAVVPASEVVTQLHDMNGIVGPQGVFIGGDLLTAASLDLHALTLPASGALHCEPTG